MAGLLINSGCTTTTACGADGVCAAYGRVMAWALILLGLVRIAVASGSGVGVWAVGVAAHVAETLFWWSEYILATMPRLAALSSRVKRERNI